MRIAAVGGDDLPGDDHGQLCAALAGHGHEVTRYVRRRDPGAPEAVTVQDHRVVQVCAGPHASLPAAEVLPFVGDWAAELGRLWSSDPPHVVHAYGWLAGLAAQLAARRQRLPVVQTFHGLATLTGPDDGAGYGSATSERARLEPLLARNATWVTGGSSGELDALARLRRGRARLSVLSTGVDVARYSPSGPPRSHRDRYRVLCLEENPLPCNGFDKPIRILPKVPGAELVIAETAEADHRHDEERAALRNLATTLGVGDRVRFVGTVAGDELPKLLRSADVVACTPRQWPRATTALQAMATGVSVVAEAVGALADMVVHSVTGLVVAPDNPVELTSALKNLQAQTFQREGMGAAGRSRAMARYTWERIAFEALSVYQEVATEHIATDRRMGA